MDTSIVMIDSKILVYDTQSESIYGRFSALISGISIPYFKFEGIVSRDVCWCITR